MAGFVKAEITGEQHYTTENCSRIITDEEIAQLNDMQDAIAGLTGVRASYQADLAAGATGEQIAAAVNGLKGALITAGIMSEE